MLCVDGGQGLLVALPTVYPAIPVQRCWAHKIRKVLNKVRQADQEAVRVNLHAIINGDVMLDKARGNFYLWSISREAQKARPEAVACLCNDLDDLLTCFRYPTLAERKQARITNAIERRFREVRRRTRPIGTCQDRTAIDRILYAVFVHENKAQGISTPFF